MIMLIIASGTILLAVAGFAALAEQIYNHSPKLAAWFDRWAGNEHGDVEESKWKSLL